MPALIDLPSDQPVDQIESDAIESIIQSNLERAFPGITLMVAQEGQVRLHRAWGYIDPETRVLPAQTDSLFDLASITKIFTVTALLSLLSEHRIDLHTPLIEIIPEFGVSDPRPVDGGQDPHTKETLPVPDDLRNLIVDPARVTLWHLLTHTSGLAPWRDVYRAAGPAPAPPDQPEPVARAQRWERALQAICGYAFVGEPDGIVRYSDLGLMLLGEVVRRLSGLELDEAIDARVLQPLGLDSPCFDPVRGGRDRRIIHPTEVDAIWRKRRVWGEVHDENADGAGGVAGHAGLFATARDVAALGLAWLDEDPRLAIPPDLMQLARQEHAVTGDMRRGLGWHLKARIGSSAGDLLSDNTFGHTGFTGNSLWIDPDKSLIIVTLTNAVYYGRSFEGFYDFRRAVHDAVVRVVKG